MNSIHAAEKAIELLAKHGLHDWQFKFDRARRRFGGCSHATKTISLSLLFTELNTEHEVVNTLLHEIAHALVGPRHKHDDVWRTKALAIGCNGDRCYSINNVVQPKGKYQAVCQSCSLVFNSSRLVKKDKACRQCCKLYNGGRYAEVFRLNYVATR